MQPNVQGPELCHLDRLLDEPSFGIGAIITHHRENKHRKVLRGPRTIKQSDLMALPDAIPSHGRPKPPSKLRDGRNTAAMGGGVRSQEIELHVFIEAYHDLGAQDVKHEPSRSPQSKQVCDDALSSSEDLSQCEHPTGRSSQNPVHLKATVQPPILAFLQMRQAQCIIESSIGAPVSDLRQIRSGMVENLTTTIFPSDDRDSPVVGDIMSGWTDIKDAVALLNIGCSTKDGRSLMEGRKKHLLTVQALRQQLQNPDTIEEEVLATALDLIFCEMYLPVSSTRTHTDLTTHLMGVQAILKWTDDHADSRMGSWLSILYGQLDLMHGLIHRTPLLLEKRPLSSVPWPIAPGSVCALMQIICSLPSLLHTAEHVKPFNRPETHKELQTTRQALFILEDNLFCWLTKFKPSPNVLAACAATPPEGDSDRDPLVFRSHSEGLTLNMYWVARLLIAQALLRLKSLLAATEKLSSAPSDQPKSNFAAEADRYAALLCRSIPSLSRSCGGHISKGLALRAPIYFAGKWYERSGYEDGLRWCREVEKQVKAELTWLNWEALLPWSLFTIIWTGVGMRQDGTIAVCASR